MFSLVAVTLWSSQFLDDHVNNSLYLAVTGLGFVFCYILMNQFENVKQNVHVNCTGGLCVAGDSVHSKSFLYWTLHSKFHNVDILLLQLLTSAFSSEFACMQRWVKAAQMSCISGDDAHMHMQFLN